MARNLKLPLEMADGTMVRANIEDLRKHFDMQSVLGHFISGKLQKWLENNYYDEEAEKISALDKDDEELNKKLCAILGVEYTEIDKTDIDNLQRINEKKAILRQVTSDTTVIDNAEWVAFDQEELVDLLDEDVTTIYLYGDKFSIPIRRKDMTYIGVNNPQISINAKEYKEIGDNDIKFVNVTLPERLQPIQAKNKTEYKSLDFFEWINQKYGEKEAKAEKLYLENKFEESIEIFKNEAKSGNLRAYYFLVDNNINAFGSLYRDKEYEIECRKECLKSDDPTVKVQGLYVYPKETGEFENEFSKIKDNLFKQALEGDPFAAFEVLCLKWDNYYEVPEDIMEKCKHIILLHNHCKAINRLGVLADENGNHEKANEYYFMASKKGYPMGQYNLAVNYENGQGVEKDLATAFELYKAAAEKGMIDAIYKIGICYYTGYIVGKNHNEAIKWFKRGAEKKHVSSQTMLENATARVNKSAKIMQIKRSNNARDKSMEKEMHEMHELMREAREELEEAQRRLNDPLKSPAERFFDNLFRW
ncbi:hypothetical protein NZ47_08010 [Anaerovibrio lipolyticus]|uniref:Sel1 repeat protein n=2 Tax=Anaerovibrio lipolyticus TaxID=82374 RepID=A0A0B2JWB8_9FIRM|nr:tetratricopeptide repeat protein [Anaerovibrio lipolyticus]KHM51894.1 hypothetical protein NZ47_08010 [Anaerovibrio lipolyticus]